jgi:hypothetical protein
MSVSTDAHVCPSCGARERVQRDGQLRCGFCGQALVARLLPGTLCTDEHCRGLALALCRGCTRPLCERHAAPGRAYWNTRLHWRWLFPHWTAIEGLAWARLLQPLARLPVAGFEPFPWVAYDRACQRDIGELDEELLQAARRVAVGFGGEAGETGAGFAELCNTCEGQLEARFDALAEERAAQYRQRAFVNRLDALEAELHQAQRYVETFLGQPLERDTTGAPGDGVPSAELSLGTPPEQWAQLGRELLHRLELVTQLRARLDAPPA